MFNYVNALKAIILKVRFSFITTRNSVISLPFYIVSVIRMKAFYKFIIFILNTLLQVFKNAGILVLETLRRNNIAM